MPHGGKENTMGLDADVEKSRNPIYSWACYNNATGQKNFDMRCWLDDKLELVEK